MFGSHVLEVGIGLIFTFLAVSLIAGAIVEAIGSATRWRANMLKSGIQTLLNDPNFEALAKELFDHAAINPHGPGASAPQPSPTTAQARKPSYIDKEQFANALMDILGMTAAIAAPPPAPAAAAPPPPAAAAADLIAALKDAVNNKIAQPAPPPPAAAPPQNPQIAQFLHHIIDRSLGDPDNIRTELATWFDTGMDRLSGVYKRYMQLLSFAVALVLAVTINIDSIQIAKAVWDQPTLAENLKPPAGAAGSPGASSADASRVLTTLDQYLPIGWHNGFGKKVVDTQTKWFGPWDWVFAIAGWLITAVATLFGAPFWFDMLQSIIRLKGSGPSPAEKVHGRAAGT